MALRNYAIILRDTGLIEPSIQFFQQVVDRSQGRAKAFACESLAVTFMRMGRELDAADLFAEGRSLLGAQDKHQFYQKYLLAEIGARLNLGEIDKAKQLAKGIAPPEEIHYAALMPLAGVLSIFADMNYEIPNTNLGHVIDLMEQQAEYFVDQGEYFVSILLYRAAGLAARRHYPTRAKSLFERDLALCKFIGRLPAAVSIVYLAAIAFEEREIERAVQYLWQLPVALAAQFGSIGKQIDALDALAGLGSGFDRLTTAAIESELPFEYLPFIADVRRNPLQKARFIDSMVRSKHGATDFKPVMPIDAVSFVKEGALPFSVIEFLQSNKYIVSLVTHVSSTNVVTEVLEPVDVDLRRLSEDIRFRLET